VGLCRPPRTEGLPAAKGCKAFPARPAGGFTGRPDREQSSHDRCARRCAVHGCSAQRRRRHRNVRLGGEERWGGGPGIAASARHPSPDTHRTVNHLVRRQLSGRLQGANGLSRLAADADLLACAIAVKRREMLSCVLGFRRRPASGQRRAAAGSHLPGRRAAVNTSSRRPRSITSWRRSVHTGRTMPPNAAIPS
jgi:hypothetical protein